MNTAPRGCCLALASALLGCSLPVTSDLDGSAVDSFALWARVEIVLDGPPSASDGRPNPFAVVLSATFRGPSGQSYTVPGFYDGDGNAGAQGNVWKIRFAADEVGEWSYRTASDAPALDKQAGRFIATAASKDAPELYRWGRLESVGTPADGIRYLKFRDGPYWLKAGMDDPENFLGSFQSYDTMTERRAAVDELAGRGINSLYVMTHNLDGDNSEVWPWLGKTAEQAKANSGEDARFDVAKLDAWLDIFEYMQRRGLVVYLVLEDDSAWSGYDHARYYRELIARFGHLPALLFNFCEEYNEHYSLPEALSYMELLRQIDPYKHPRGIHNVNTPNEAYIDATQIDFTSIQTDDGALEHNERTIAWISSARARERRVPMIGFDEPRPLMDRRGWWSAYIGGGVWEVHVDRPYDRPMSAWATALDQAGGARAFMETLPFWEMEPDNSLVRAGTAFCLAAPGSAYALYLPEGRAVTVELARGTEYAVDWWRATNDRSGRFEDGGRVAGGPQTFTPPADGDWALRIRSIRTTSR